MMIDNEAKYTIGITAKMVGVSVQLLRVYEREAFIIPEKTESGRRLYSDLEVTKALCIRKMINETGINYAGIRRLMALLPCWKIRDCTQQDRSVCSAYNNSDRPCWATEEKCGHLLNPCRDCIVYQSSIDCNDLKRLIFD